MAPRPPLLTARKQGWSRCSQPTAQLQTLCTPLWELSLLPGPRAAPSLLPLPPPYSAQDQGLQLSQLPVMAAWGLSPFHPQRNPAVGPSAACYPGGRQGGFGKREATITVTCLVYAIKGHKEET